MLQKGVILLSAFLYLGVLFAIAYLGDRRADQGRSLIANPYIYTLSIAVYCTAWTFYGSVGRASVSGVGFLPIYLGPTLMAALWWLVLRKIIRIAKQHRLTSIADFIGSRYGKSAFLAGLVTVIAVIGIMPYISLQLKAISISYQVLGEYPALKMPASTPQLSFLDDTTFYVAMLLAAFTILFGTRHIDVTERHEGMVAAIAFESLVKLAAFIAVGLFVTFEMFDGPRDIFARAAAHPGMQRLMTMEGIDGGYASWLSLTFLSMMAILFLPRQFQVAVVENVNEDHVRKAAWLFPLYLFAINLFVLPIGFGGDLRFSALGLEIDPDTFVLTLPMLEQREGLALFVFIGGLSAATGMVIVATIALATMVSNDLVMPALLRFRSLQLAEREDLSGLLLAIRRWTIVGILLLGYLYFRLIGDSFALVTTGLVSFAAAAQFAPAILIGVYWKGASHAGAIAGLAGGFLVWAYTLLLPGFALSGWLPVSFVEQGPFGIELLKPYALFGLDGFDSVTHAVFWSMLANVGGIVIVSLFTDQRPIEQVQGALFVDAFSRTADDSLDAYHWTGTTTVGELRALARRFLGAYTAELAIERYAAEHDIAFDNETAPDPRFTHFIERQLAGAVGAASARVLVSSAVKGEALSIEGVMRILDETSQVMEYSRRLEAKSHELEAATRSLRSANERLKELDLMKDDFVNTVSHELRTPLTSIRAFSEIVLNNPAMEEAQRREFMGIVVKETERLTRLINDLLDLSKIESGRMEWHMERHDLRDLVAQACSAVSQLFNEKGVELVKHLPEQEILVQVDGDKIIQAVINLLSNACKFCPDEAGRVSIRAEQQRERVRIEVSDNGPGIPPQHLESVFDKFRQLEDPRAGKPGGTGLGLPICRGIVERHGGRIWAEAVIDGARFVFELPMSAEDGRETVGADTERLDL